MNEATGIATAQREPSIPLYPLDQAEIEVRITAGNKTLCHKLRKPTLAQLMEREAQIRYESEAISNEEERINSDDEAANARLWDALAASVKGYRLGKTDTQPVDAWRNVDEALKTAIPAAHKSTAVRSMYAFVCEVERDEDEGFTLGDAEWTVRQVFGDVDNPAYIVRHILRTPTESERRAFRQKSAQVSFTKGSRKQKTRIATNLKAYVELYDALTLGLDGVTGGGSDSLDPLWKRAAIDCLMRSFDASLSD